MDDKIKTVSLWHIIPIDLGSCFLDLTVSTIEINSYFYDLVNSNNPIDRKQYNKNDYLAIINIRNFLSNVKESLLKSDNKVFFSKVHFVPEYPNIIGCIAKFELSEFLSCYILITGTAVFLNIGEPISFESESYFSIPAFYERQVIENDYCNNPEETDRKRPVYLFMRVLWNCMQERKRKYSSSVLFRNNGISYALCLTCINIPSLISNNVSEELKKNIFALLDTSAFNNILDTNQWELIKSRIDNDSLESLELSKMSENLVMSDNWSGVVIAGNLEKNQTCIKWFIEFEIFLQSMWLLFDVYCENVKYQNYSSIDLQKITNIVEYYIIQLENDISSNMEQSRHNMRNSLIDSSNIRTIFNSMKGTLENKMKLNVLYDEKRKGKFSFLSDVVLLIIAIMQIYGVINSLLLIESFNTVDILSICITMGIAICCIWIMAKGRF